jgi:CheY-like chemotaxis protein
MTIWSSRSTCRSWSCASRPSCAGPGRKRSRTEATVNEVVVGDVVLDCRTFKVTTPYQTVLLTNVQFDLLYHLMSHADQVFNSQQLLQDVWDYPRDTGSPELVRAHIKNLREKIEPLPAIPSTSRQFRDTATPSRLRRRVDRPPTARWRSSERATPAACRRSIAAQRRPTPACRTGQWRPAAPGPWTTARILVVDDEIEIADSLAEFLMRKEGFQVEIVHDGPAGHCLSGEVPSAARPKSIWCSWTCACPACRVWRCSTGFAATPTCAIPASCC